MGVNYALPNNPDKFCTGKCKTNNSDCTGDALTGDYKGM